jgi:cupin 2 domain-containing protein
MGFPTWLQASEPKRLYAGAVTEGNGVLWLRVTRGDGPGRPVLDLATAPEWPGYIDFDSRVSGSLGNSTGEGFMTEPTGDISGNLFAALPAVDEREIFQEILLCRNVRIERIVSSGRPDLTLYDQAQDEWVVLLQGEAELWIAGANVRLQAGDFRFIPAHTLHRVLRTTGEPPCIWLAVHIADAPARGAP